MKKQNLNSINPDPGQEKPNPDVRHHVDEYGFWKPDPDELPFGLPKTKTLPDGDPAPDNDPGFDPGAYDCENCAELLDCYKLVDSLVHEILYLEEDVVNWRHALVRYLKHPTAEYLQDEIFDGLAQRYYDNEAYQRYLNLFSYKKDPMESKKHSKKLHRLAKGTDKDSINL